MREESSCDNPRRSPKKKGGIAFSGSVKKASALASGVKRASTTVVKVGGKTVQGTASSVVKASNSVARASGKAIKGTAKTLNPTKLLKKSSKKTREELGSEAAEDSLIANLEDRSRRTLPTADGFRPAVDGERVPLGIDNLGFAFDEESPPPAGDNTRPSLKNMAQMYHSNQMNVRTVAGHRRARTLLESIDESAGDANISQGLADDIKDTFGAHHHDFQELEDVLSDHSNVRGASFIPISNVHCESPVGSQAPEQQPLLNGDQSYGYSSVTYQRLQQAKRNKTKQRIQRFLWCLNPVNIVKGLINILLFPFLVWALPLYVMAWILFYYLGNPSLDFLPGGATLSWWMNFVGRQIFLLQISVILQIVIIDYLILSSRFVVKIVGSWMTIFCLQSKGWPFVVGCWGVLCLFVLHGDSAFIHHWLYFTGIRLYSSANSGSYILNSDQYLRALIGMVLAGLATSVKRTLVTLYFGTRSIQIYKPKLEEILNDIIVISEVAELAAEADLLSDENERKPTSGTRGKNLVRWGSVRFNQENPQRNRSETADSEDLQVKDQDDDDQSDEDAGDVMDEICTASENEEEEEEETDRGADLNATRPDTPIVESSRKHFKIKNLLGRWDDPLNKMDKPLQTSVEDILKFRKALTYMDLEHPFSESFGAASTRDELITSSQNVYHRLLKLCPGATVLPYSALTVLADNGDGTYDKSKRNTLKALFRPNVDKQIPLLSFISSCDICYKKLRYFRASVGNSSVIDNVLENIIDTIYYFVLVITILSLLNLNPWPLLVSTSTLLVTFAFAVGPSCARAIEGIILIVGRRPYDIGDRIVISSSPGDSVPGVTMSWFVEDITLFSTTLRFGANNEVATVSNGSIANARITNCARSKKATVSLLLKLHLRFHEGDIKEKFQEALDGYVLSHPNIWDSTVFFRCEDIDTDNEFVMYRLVLKSNQSWQPSVKVLEHRSDLHRFCLELAGSLGVLFESPIPRMVVYTGEFLEGAKDYKKDLLSPDNVRTMSTGDTSERRVRTSSNFEFALNALQEQAEIAGEAKNAEVDGNVSIADDNGSDEELENISNQQAVMQSPEAAIGRRSSDDNMFLSMLQQSHDG